MYIDPKQARKCIDTTHAYSVQPTRNLIRILVELTTCVEDRHHYLKRGLALFGMHGNRNPATVVFDCYTVAFVNDHVYHSGMAREGLVNRVVHDLVYEVVKAFLAYITDVHRGALAHRF